MYGHLVPCRGGRAIPLDKTLIYLGKCLQGNDRSSRERSCFCELSLENDKWVIRQVDSPYEIRINGHPVQAAELNSGDLIAIGKLRYRLQLVDGSPSNGSKTRQGGRSGGGVLSLFGLVRKKAEESSGPPVLGVLVPCRGGKATPLRKERTTVGRDKTCDVVIDDKTVSGLHCGLEYSQGHWKVVDLGSTNGILVNGVAYQSKWLVPGDELMISLHRFCIKYHPVGDLPEHDDVPCTAKSLSELAGIGDNLADRIASRHKSLEERTTERTDGSNDPLAAAEPTAADLE